MSARDVENGVKRDFKRDAENGVNHNFARAVKESNSEHPVKESKNYSIIALMIALFVSIFSFQLNISMLSPALASMEYELHISQVQVGLIQTVFFTSAALFSLFLPRLADHIGRKKVLLGILTATVIGSFISAITSNIVILSIGRIMQGSSGPMMPLCLIMLRERVKDGKRYARLMAILTSVNGGIAGIDALVGGWMSSECGFRSIFWIMALIAVFAVFLVICTTEESKAVNNAKMDWFGVITLSIAFLSMYIAIDESQKLLNARFWIISLLVCVSIVFFIIFWQIEKHISNPMVSTNYMKHRRTWGLLSTTLLTMTGVFAIMNGVVLKFAQDKISGIGLSEALVPFVTLTPYAIVGFLCGPISGFLASKYGYRRVLRSGILVSIIGLLCGIFVMKNPSIPGLVALSVLLGISYAGVANIMLNGLGIVLSPKDNPGYLPGMNAEAFNLGAGLSFAIIYAIMGMFNVNITQLSIQSSPYISASASSNAASNAVQNVITVVKSVPSCSSYVSSMIVGAVLLVGAILCSLWIPKSED